MIAVGVDKGIHATCVIFEVAAVAFREACSHALCRRPHLQYTLHTVVRDQFFPEKLSYFTRSQSARHVHLPKTILSCDITLCFKEIIKRPCFDMRHAMLVSTHVHGRGKSRQAHLSVELWQGIAHGMFEPPCAAQYASRQRDDEKNDKTKKKAENRMSPLLL